ncbi:MAG: ABC transporter permease, partial [Defluviitaleaceae bacterium]|nr:ABC transporter permease [Defluviitaleaceae bacterium]
LVIMLAVFALIGILSPLTALIMPQIIGAMDLGGVTITLPEPTAMDAWGQFFGNTGLMGMLVVIIVFSGIMANEFSRGTLINLLTKGLSRSTVIISKFVAASLTWTVAYLLCLGVAIGYIAFYWELDLQNAVLAFASLWLFGELLIAILVFGGTLFGSFAGSLALTGGSVVALMLINIAPGVARFNPMSLAGGTLTLLNGEQSPGDFMPAVVISIIAIIMLVVASMVAFGKKLI